MLANVSDVKICLYKIKSKGCDDDILNIYIEWQILVIFRFA